MTKKLVAKADHDIEIVATLERVPGSCPLSNPRVVDGRLEFDSGPGTEMHWDAQYQVTNQEGERCFLDKDGNEYLESEIELIDVEEEEEDEEEDLFDDLELEPGAIAAWNRRADPSELSTLRAQVAELEGENERLKATQHHFKDEDWPLALQRLKHTEPGTDDQGLAVVGTGDLEFALERLAHFAQVAMGNAVEVGRLETALSTATDEVERLRAGLEVAQAALNMWTVQYAPDMCREEDVALLHKTITGGTLAYIADVHQAIDAALTGRAK